MLRKSLESLVRIVDSDCTSLFKASRVAQLGVDVVSEDDSNSLKKHTQTRFFSAKAYRSYKYPGRTLRFSVRKVLAKHQ